ncbi:MAG: prepilin-type N-terminal cleavage/methylation domain-containing protein, partial [Burkholderiaceae bacterium]|nr:prepilin-type N-terminal cleavage/methylation domain-containing protein [Burkholderiaceae bacterium]
MNGPQRHRHAARGLSMIEVLVAIVLISFGILGLVSLQARAVQFSVSAEDSQRAALLAGELAATMWGANTVSLTPAVVTAWTNRVKNASIAGLPNATGTVDVDAGGTIARITVQWRANHAASGQENRYVTDVV